MPVKTRRTSGGPGHPAPQPAPFPVPSTPSRPGK